MSGVSATKILPRGAHPSRAALERLSAEAKNFGNMISAVAEIGAQLYFAQGTLVSRSLRSPPLGRWDRRETRGLGPSMHSHSNPDETQIYIYILRYIYLSR